jgi:MFS family permease
VQNRWQLFAAQVVAGLATGLIEPAWDSLFTDDMEESSAKHWSIWAGGTHLAAGVAALLGGVIVAYFSFKTLFVSMALIDVVATFLAWRSAPAKDALMVPQIPEEEPEAASSEPA